MNIGYDGKRATNNLTGLGNYSRSLIKQLALQFSSNQYFIYSPKIKEKLLKESLFSLKNVFIKLPQSSKFLWRSLGIKKQLINDKIDLFHGLSNEIPVGLNNTSIKTVVTIHDLIFLRKPSYYKFIDRTIYNLKSRYACKYADKIIAISECTKRDIIEFYNIDAHKIEVIYQSCDDSFKTLLSDDEKEKVRKKYHLPQHFLLSLGTIEERKNLLLIIKSLPDVNQNIPLIVIGKETSYIKKVKKEIEVLGLTHRVVFLKNIPFSDLPAIYQMADIFIYPSFYEGFGIPIIEALYSQIPVIGAKGSCLEEAGGPDSIYVSPHNNTELTKAINEILSNKELRQKMIQKGVSYVQRFNENLVTKELMNCYSKILSS